MTAKQNIVLITGATSGIGRETALHLARLGHRVLATGRKPALLAELEAEAGPLPLETFTLDVNDPASIDAAVQEVETRTAGHGIDVLVNNAGFGNMAPMELITDADMRGMFETNVFGLVRLCQRFLPAMRARGAGKIINVSSVVGRLVLPLQGIYCATKHAVEALTDALRVEVAGLGIHVSLVEPGSIATHFGATATSTVSKYETMDSPYREGVRTYQRVLEKTYQKAPGPQCIAKTVARIIRRRRPAARYVSPRFNALAIWFFRWFPTRFMDGILRRVMGLTPKALRAPRASRNAS